MAVDVIANLNDQSTTFMSFCRHHHGDLRFRWMAAVQKGLQS